VNECKPLVVGQRAVVRRGAAYDNIPLSAKHGSAVQVGPIKPTLKAPGVKLLKPTYGEALSILALNFNLRRYSTGNNKHMLLGGDGGRGLHSSTLQLNLSHL